MIEQPWIGQYQSEWQCRTANPRLPKWFRVVALAYGTHTMNGHSPQPPGAIADMLGTVNPETGELFPDRHVSRWIGDAIELGFLAKESSARCLIVPGHTFRSAPGSSRTPCSWCSTRRRRRVKSTP